MKAARAVTATASKVRMRGLVQPRSRPRISAKTRAVSDVVMAAVPAQSVRPPAGSRDSRSLRKPRTRAAAPMGMLMKKIDRQPKASVSAPPASGAQRCGPADGGAERAQGARE
jgi:hypothetical protein